MVPETSRKPSLEIFPRSGLHLQNLQLPRRGGPCAGGADRKAAKEDIERRSSCLICKGVRFLSAEIRSGTGLRSRCGCGSSSARAPLPRESAERAGSSHRSPASSLRPPRRNPHRCLWQPLPAFFDRQNPAANLSEIIAHPGCQENCRTPRLDPGAAKPVRVCPAAAIGQWEARKENPRKRGAGGLQTGRKKQSWLAGSSPGGRRSDAPLGIKTASAACRKAEIKSRSESRKAKSRRERGRYRGALRTKTRTIQIPQMRCASVILRTCLAGTAAMAE